MSFVLSMPLHLNRSNHLEWSENRSSINQKLKLLLIACILFFAMLSAWALPKPSEVQAVLKAGDFPRAESMLREIIKERPESAGAHYLLGQTLAKLGKNVEAHKALNEAKRLEPTLKFAPSPEKFNQIVANIPQTDSKPSSSGAVSGSNIAVTPAATSPVATSSVANAVSAPAQNPAPTPAPEKKGFPWGTLLGIGMLVMAAFWLIGLKNRNKAQNSNFSNPTNMNNMNPMNAMQNPMNNGLNSAGGGMWGNQAQGSGHYPQQYPNQHPQYPQQNASGGLMSGATGAVLGGLAGAAAGYGLAKAFEGDKETASSSAGSAQAATPNATGFTPIDNPSPMDFELGNNASDSWDSSDSGGGDDW